MTFDKFNRRTHLYVGLTLLLWFFMYGLSSFPLAHKSAPPNWLVRGVYMWWYLRRLRFWGTVGLGGGIGAFLIFMYAL